MGIVDMVTGANPNQGQINTSNNAAQQATDTQNQLIQKALLPAYQQLMQYYNQTTPVQSPVASIMQGLAGSNTLNPLSQLSSVLANNPTLMQAITGINSTGSTQNAVNVLENTGGDVSGLAGVGGQALHTAMNPTNLQAISPTMSAFYQNEATHGLSPQTIGAALNTQQAQDQSEIGSLRNSLGAASPNINGAIQAALQGQQQGLIGTESALAGQNQGVQNAGIQGLGSTASTLDDQTLKRALVALGISSGIDTQNQKQLMQGANLANSVNQQQTGNINTAFGLQGENVQNLLSYLQGGTSALQGGASGTGSIANLYGSAAGGAAN
ncbi:MAG: hypothetical protein ACREQ5_17555, partial [Candidatus Dormibacteria bacterium]